MNGVVTSLKDNTQYNTTDLKEIIKEEYKKCVLNPAYFLKKYCLIQHPDRGKIKFELFKYQEDALESFLKNNFNIILKGRQIGVSTLVAGYALWLMTFHTDKNILVIATKQETAKNLVTKVKVMFDNLPTWLRSKTIEDNKLSIRFVNGSQIKAISSNPEGSRSESLSLLIIDECAFVENAEAIWTASYATIQNGKVLLLSTPNGVGNFFHKKWIEATEGGKDETTHIQLNPIKLDWRVHPDRDQAWRDRQTKILGKEAAAQEHDADFISSGNPFIPGEWVEYCRQSNVKEPIEKTGIDKNLWIWEYPVRGRSYAVSGDVARGDGNDKSAFHVIDLETCKQVAEYRGLIDTRDFGDLLVYTATQYNDAYLIVENSNQGWDTIQQIIARNYKNMHYTVEDLHYVDAAYQFKNKYRAIDKNKVAGFTMSERTRPLVLSRLYDYIKEKSVVIQSIRTIDELFVFIWNGRRAEAQQGYNDDLVMSLAIGLWIRDTALKLHQENIDLQKLALENMGKIKYDAVYKPLPSHLNYDPWNLSLGQGHDPINFREFLG